MQRFLDSLQIDFEALLDPKIDSNRKLPGYKFSQFMLEIYD